MRPFSGTNGAFRDCICAHRISAPPITARCCPRVRSPFSHEVDKDLRVMQRCALHPAPLKALSMPRPRPPAPSPVPSLPHPLSLSTSSHPATMAFIGTPLLPAHPSYATRSVLAPRRRLHYRTRPARLARSTISANAREVTDAELEVALQASERPLVIDCYAGSSVTSLSCFPALSFTSSPVICNHYSHITLTTAWSKLRPRLVRPMPISGAAPG